MNLNKPYNSSCPKCRTQEAYVSMLNVECVNEECEEFSHEHLNDVIDYESTMGSILTVFEEKDNWGETVNNPDQNDLNDEELDEFAAFFSHWNTFFSSP